MGTGLSILCLLNCVWSTLRLLQGSNTFVLTDEFLSYGT